MSITVTVDMTKCQHYGQCCFEAPTVFELDAEGKLQVLQHEVDESLRDEVEAAADVCPMQAITLS
ncbi:MAG: ferredoxin [Actinomycetales bacterium]|nr:ferredoxin [Actinomycetales bacterium]